MIKDFFALRLGTLSDYILAIAGTLWVAIFAGMMSHKLLEMYPQHDPKNLRAINDTLARSDGSEYIYFVIFLCITVPIIEELMFRGVLWKMVEFAFSPIIALISVSILFALAHGDLLHIIGVFPIGLWMGWLRYRSNSIFPSILAHMTNNTFATLAIISANIGG